jgi:hypothetical protein
MLSVLVSLLLTLRTWARSRAALQLEVLALRHQLQVLQVQQRLVKTGAASSSTPVTTGCCWPRVI